jgi:hypothetical protein
MGGSFYLGWLIPRGTSLAIWGFERQRVLKDQGKFSLSQNTAKKIVKMKVFHIIGTCLQDKATIKLKCATVVSTS